eukprot:TRINITY_DN67684_c9_g1_i1.p1 TRINITY_DN67684_c9_g1~~TRINITY_DN67684_c9_g1_i1.p1  ORF type:complete len:343 (-),score=21.56 TRINITY_DN67684_c9_g1_i1:360-1346(-)
MPALKRKRDLTTHKDIADDLERIANSLSTGERGCDKHIPAIIKEHFSRTKVVTSDKREQMATIYAYFCGRVRARDTQGNRWALPAHTDSVLQLLMLQTDEWDEWQERLGIHAAEEGVSRCFLGLVQRPSSTVNLSKPLRLGAFQDYLSDNFPSLAKSQMLKSKVWKFYVFAHTVEKHNPPMCIEVPLTTTWKDVKEVIYQQEGIAPYRQHLFHKAERLPDDGTVETVLPEQVFMLFDLPDPDPEDEVLQLSVRHPYSGATLGPFKVPSMTTVGELALHVSQAGGLHPTAQIFHCADLVEELHHRRTCYYYDLHDGEELYLALPKLRGC